MLTTPSLSPQCSSGVGSVSHSHCNAGLDWDELEEQAAQEDREKDYSDEEGGEEAGRKRKSAAPPAAKSKKPSR